MTIRPIASPLLVTALLALAACAEPADRAPDIRAPAVEVAGEPVDCIQTSRIQNTTVHDDYTIDFALSGGVTHRNTLPVRCNGLGFDRRFAYKVNTNRLCSVDTITVLQSGGGRGVTCGLGEFVPVRYTDAG